MIIELRHLKTFTILRDSQTLSEAADRLCVTQSALSHQIKDLEARLGTTLFLRKTRPLKFTDAGLRLLKLADDILTRVQEAEREIHQYVQGDGGRLHMAIECHSCFNWLMPTVTNFRNQWPGVDLDFSSGFIFDPLTALQDEDVDVVVTSDPQPLEYIHYEPLFTYESLVAIAPDHPLAEATAVEPADFVNETLITYPVDTERLDVYKAFLLPVGCKPRDRRTAELTLMMLQLVISKRGLCVLPNWVLAEYAETNTFVTRPLGQKGLWSTLYLAYRQQQADKEYLKDFIIQAKNHCFTHLSGIRAIKTKTESV